MKLYNVAVAGATGLVGRTFLKVLEEYNFPINNLVLYASKRSAGSVVVFKGKEYVVEELTEDSFDNIDIALFSAGGGVSKQFAPIEVSELLNATLDRLEQLENAEVPISSTLFGMLMLARAVHP